MSTQHTLTFSVELSDDQTHYKLYVYDNTDELTYVYPIKFSSPEDAHTILKTAHQHTVESLFAFGFKNA